MFGFLTRRGKQQPGWLSISLQPGRLHFAHAMPGAERISIARCGTEAIGDDKALERLVKERGFDRYRCLTILAPSDYQLLLVEAPSVPPAELKNAAR